MDKLILNLVNVGQSYYYQILKWNNDKQIYEVIGDFY